MKKILTKDCPSCNLCIINDAGEFQCNWGKAKKRKILSSPAIGKAKYCKLKRIK